MKNENHTESHLTWDQAAEQVRQAVRIVAYHKEASMTYEDVRAMCPGMTARFICEQAELAGFPVWSHAPDEAFQILIGGKS